MCTSEKAPARSLRLFPRPVSQKFIARHGQKRDPPFFNPHFQISKATIHLSSTCASSGAHRQNQRIGIRRLMGPFFNIVPCLIQFFPDHDASSFSFSVADTRHDRFFPSALKTVKEIRRFAVLPAGQANLMDEPGITIPKPAKTVVRRRESPSAS